MSKSNFAKSFSLSVGHNVVKDGKPFGRVVYMVESGRAVILYNNGTVYEAETTFNPYRLYLPSVAQLGKAGLTVKSSDFGKYCSADSAWFKQVGSKWTLEVPGIDGENPYLEVGTEVWRDSAYYGRVCAIAGDEVTITRFFRTYQQPLGRLLTEDEQTRLGFSDVKKGSYQVLARSRFERKPDKSHVRSSTEPQYRFRWVVK